MCAHTTVILLRRWTRISMLTMGAQGPPQIRCRYFISKFRCPLNMRGEYATSSDSVAMLQKCLNSGAEMSSNVADD